ncbi:hypothetical protein L6R52_19750 [Myxococcota bacterium]|nr:hypothetical protein [Myxococcota bacterium]
MDRAWIDAVVGLLGPRYKLGPLAGDGVELHYRSGKSEFRPSRFVLGGGASGRDLELTVDVRIPKGTAQAEADALVAVFEAKTAAPRGFVRAGESSMEMKSDLGAAAGSVKSLRYVRTTPVEPPYAAKHVRAIVESIDIPIVVGIHEAEHLVARDPAPPAPKVKRPAQDPMELWEYQLDGGLLRSLTVIVDPNDRTLRVVERQLVSKRPVGETLKLAHVAKLGVRKRTKDADLVAIKRDGTELTLATGSGNDEFVATAGRLAKKVLIPFETLP